LAAPVIDKIGGALMGEFVKAASASEIPPGEMKIVEIDDREIAIANLNGEFVAFQNECTHRGGPLGEGILMGDVVECPFHAGQFNVRTGEVVSAPPDAPIATYAVQVEGDDLKVEKP
jgi:nitrite reductase/ring-hydroxylating ferredoxin subunit